MTNFLIGYADIPLTATSTANKTEDSSYPRTNIIGGQRGEWHQLSTATADDYYITYELGSSPKSGAYLSIQRAKLLKKANVKKVRLIGCTLPTNITGCKLWLDATRSVTKDGSNNVSQWDDLSGTGNNATSSGGNRPVWVAPASGINGNAAISFTSASSQYMTANGLASTLTGDDTPFSMFAVIKKDTSASDRVIFSFGNSALTTNYHSVVADPADYYSVRHDGTATTVVGNVTVGTTAHVVSTVFSGTTFSLWQDGSVVINAAAQNKASITIDRVAIGALIRSTVANHFQGLIGEVIVFNSALSTSDRQEVENYLTQKWTTNTQAQETALDSADLVGPRAEDFINAFTASSSYRNWVLQLGTDGTNTSKYPLGKTFFGSWFDFGREPAYPFLQRREAYSSGSREARHIFECEWQGIDDATLESFIDKVVKYRDIFPVVLYDAGDYCLNDMRTMHAWLTRFDVDKYSHNANNVFCVFEEAN